MSADETLAIDGIEPVLILKSSGLLMDLDVASLMPLAARVRPVALEEGQRLRDPSDGRLQDRIALFVHKGIVREVGRPDAADIGPGETCGLARCLSDAPDPFEIEARSAASLLVATRRQLLDALDDSFPIQQAVISELQRRELALRDADLDADRERGIHASANRSQGGISVAADDRGAQIRLLSESTQLRNLSVHTLGKLAFGGQGERLKDGERLWSPGDAADACALVLSGTLERKQPTHDEWAGAGSLVGLTESLARGERRDAASAQGPVEILRIRTQIFYDAIEDDPEAAENLISVLAEGLSPRRQPASGAPLSS